MTDRYLIILNDIFGKKYSVYADSLEETIRVMLEAEKSRNQIVQISVMKNNFTAEEFFKLMRGDGSSDLLFGKG